MDNRIPPAPDGNPSVNLHIEIPKVWREQLRTAAADNGLTTSALVRVILRNYLTAKRQAPA